MKKILPAVLLIVVPVMVTGKLQAEEEAAKPRGIVNRAIKAMGGAEKLEKLKAFTGREKGTYYGMGEGLPYNGVYHVQWPDSFRMEIENVFMLVSNGKQGWVKMGDMVIEMDKEQLEETRKNNYCGWVTTLVPLKDKEFKLSLIGDETINDQAAVGVMVTRKDKRDVSLYFDKKTHLLVKAAYIVKSQEHGNKEVLEEMFYNGYKEVDGIQTAAKMLIKRDGKKFVESEMTEIKYSADLDDKLFEKP